MLADLQNAIAMAKNAPVESLFEKLGFSVTEQEEGHKEYTADIGDLTTTTGVFKDVVEAWA